jgi:hypothetical protein
MLKKLPKSLQGKRLWINGRLDDKSPCNAEGYSLDPTDRDNFVTFDEAVNNHIANGDIGVGFVFKSNKKSTYVGIDLDYPKQWTNDRALKKKMLQICKASGSYYEKSTNAGFHILGVLDKGEKIGRKGRIKVGKKFIKFEVYSHDRYFLCTGKRGKAANREVATVQPLVNSLLKLISKPPAENKPEEAAPACSPHLEDENVLQVISASTQALAFSLLHYQGDLKEYNDDHSAAVMAWHSIIAFYTQDYEQVTRLFRTSKLNYGKWRHEKNRKGGKWHRINVDRDGRLGQHSKIVKGLKKVYGSELSHNKYVKLLEDEFGTVRRDLFTGDLFTFHEGQWKNALDTNVENHMKCCCQMRDEKWKNVEIIPALTHYMHSQEPRLLIDIPEWDGVDRLEQLSRCLVFSEDSITSEIFLDFLKDWGARFIARIYDPFVQNRMIILQGEQGIGKDVFLDTLVKAMGLYRAFLTVKRNDSEKDYAEVLIRSGVVIVSEFDKVRDVGAGVLKDMITKPYFSFRAAYGRKAMNFLNRASWLAACNPEQVLTDVGANRRFLVFKLLGGPGEAIRWDYDTSMAFSLQILAQFVHLCSIGYRASAENEEILKALTESYAPEDTTQMILESFDAMIVDKMATDCTEFALYSYNDLALELSRIARSFQIPTPGLLQLLKATGRRYRHREEGRLYGLVPHASGIQPSMRRERRKFLRELKQDSKGPAGLLDDVEKDDTLH